MTTREHDIIIIGAGALALYASRVARRKGFSVLRIGAGRPFERFLLLHENALRLLEKHYGTAPGHPLVGIKVLDKDLKPLRTLSFAAHGLRLHGMRYTALHALLRRHDEAETLATRAAAVSPDATVRLEDGREHRARVMALNTAGGFTRPWPRFTHRKVFRMRFLRTDVCTDYVLQINDAGTYAAIVPVGGGEAAVVTSGDEAPARALVGEAMEAVQAQELRLQTWCGWKLRQGRLFHIGEAARRVHPHTTQGLNRALDTIDAIFEGDGLLREKVYDCLMWAAGVGLDLSWGTSPFLRDVTYRLLDTGWGMKLLSGTAFWRDSATARPGRQPSGGA